ncbi:MFS transporter [Kribbella hippodromi]|uniref:MFS transporter n=1 Tax=Kribbella hippodromi TaxID=434347 RepID=A0ABP4PAJ3_9ACTN
MRTDQTPVGVRTWCGLLVLLCPALLTSMDASLLFVAGPAISAALRPTAGQWLWAMDIYHFVMAGLLMAMGSLGDRIGRKRLLLIGAAVFGGVSVLVAYAPSPEVLILARALMAIGGATLAPSTLSLIRGMFDGERQRRMAVGAWTIAFTGGAVAGPIVGGVLLNHFWWGAVFLINVPVMLVLLIVAPFLIDERRSAEPVRFDLGVLSLFRSSGFSVAVVTNAVVAFVTAGLGVLAFPFMQNVHGLTPLDSALWALPTLVGSFVGTATAAVLGDRFSSIALLSTGLLAATGSFAVIVTLDSRTGLWVFLAGYVLLTYGVGLTATIANSLVLTSAPPDRAGAASGISETATMLGAAVGIVTLGTIASTVYRTTMGDGVPPAALESVTGAVAAAGGATGLLDAAFAAYTRGLVVAALVAAAVTLILGIALIAVRVSGKAAACQRRWGE